MQVTSPEMPKLFHTTKEKVFTWGKKEKKMCNGTTVKCLLALLNGSTLTKKLGDQLTMYTNYSYYCTNQHRVN